MGRATLCALGEEELRSGERTLQREMNWGVETQGGLPEGNIGTEAPLGRVGTEVGRQHEP